MRLATFKIQGQQEPTVGAFWKELYVDLSTLTGGELPRSMLEFLKAGEPAMSKARSALEGVGAELEAADPAKLEAARGKRYAYRPGEIELMAPVPRPGKIIHTACNFDAHLGELTTWKQPEWESHHWKDFHFEHPTGFLQAPSSVVPSGARAGSCG